MGIRGDLAISLEMTAVRVPSNGARPRIQLVLSPSREVVETVDRRRFPYSDAEQERMEQVEMTITPRLRSEARQSDGVLVVHGQRKRGDERFGRRDKAAV